jgi:hypothetical protein
MPGLFNKKVLQNRIKNYSIDNLEEKIEKIKSWQQSLSKIKGLNEKRLQSAFLKALFEDILGYENTPQKDEWTLDIEATTDIDAKHPDGILGFFERVENEEIRGHEAVIELKGPQVSLDRDQKRQGTTYKSPVDQAFSYTNKLDKCKWVIVSNFMEIRLYKVGRSKEYFEVFLLDELDDIEEFKKFYYLLNKEHLISKTGKSVTLELSEKTVKKEEDISVKFYNLYKNVRVNLFEHLKENNPGKEAELLLEKAQKFLDRIIFIGFCEDKDLLPNDLLHEAIERGKNSFSPSQTAVWNQIRGVFHSIDQGNENHNINAYNGGLFEYDEDLDGLIIENEFFDVIYKISDYDFDSDVDVNILGHIFEQSITDIEKLKSDIREDEFDKNESKRKKDGIYYTPQYITSYIVENAIGSYLEDRKEELGYYDLPNIEEAGSDSWETRYTNQHLKFYNEYEEKLKNIKVLDPACGSGAFLNQAFDYLLEEHQWLNKQRDLLKGGQSSIFALDAVQRDILKNNIFGVDLNEESVEITKLSLWLKTANKRKPLTNLDENIKCGNSLIDDPVVAGDKAFKWEEKFKNIIASGGFDVVVGNPPYVRQEKIKEIKPYLKTKYSTYSGTADLYVYFIERGLDLLNSAGYFSFIISNKFIKSNYGKNLRKYISNYSIKKYKYHGSDVFQDASVDTCTILVKKQAQYNDNIITYNDDKEVFQKYLKNDGWVFLSKDKQLIMNKVNERGIALKNWDLEVKRGVLTGLNKAFIIDEETKNNLIEQDDSSIEVIKPLLRGEDIFRYRYDFKHNWLIIIENGWTNNNRKNIEAEEYFKMKYPAIYGYLKKIGDKIEEGKIKTKGRGLYDRLDQGEYWWELRPCEYYEQFKKPKIIYRDISEKLAFCYDNENMYFNNTVYFLNRGNKYLLALLNSKLINYYYKNISSSLGRNASRAFNIFVERLPIPILNKIESQKFEKGANRIGELYNVLDEKNCTSFSELMKIYSSTNANFLDEIVKEADFSNKIYSGRASKIRNYTVNINTNIVTIYLDKSSSGKYEVLKIEEDNRYKRQYLKYYLENLTDGQLAEIDDKYSGNILKKTLQIEIPDYNKKHVVKKVVQEWEALQHEIKDLEDEIDKIDRGIDKMVYSLYDLTEDEIQIVEENAN